MIVLDTNVISAMMRQPDLQLVRWLDAKPVQSLWTTSVCVFEIEFGLQSLPSGKRRTALQKAFELSLREDFENRVLDFDAAAAQAAATIAAKLRKIGRPVDIRDTMIAGIVSARRATLATRNVKHFADAEVAVVNPWDTK